MSYNIELVYSDGGREVYNRVSSHFYDSIERSIEINTESGTYLVRESVIAVHILHDARKTPQE